MSDLLRSATNLVENVLIYAAFAFLAVVGVMLVPYACLRLALWITR